MFYIQYTYKIMNTNVYNDYSFIAKLESTWLFGISELFSCTVLILYWQNLPWNWSVQRQTGSPILVPWLEYTHSSSPPFMHLIKNIKFINFFCETNTVLSTTNKNSETTVRNSYCLFLHIHDSPKGYGIEGRYNWRGPPCHMIIHALQTALHLNKKYLSDIQLPRKQ